MKWNQALWIADEV